MCSSDLFAKFQYVEEILEFGEEIDLRSKRRAEKAKKIQKARQSAAAEQGGNENQGQENKKSIATEYCEQIMDAARNLEETKREYKTVTDYLTDIQIIENLPEPPILYKKAIRGTRSLPSLSMSINSR